MPEASPKLGRVQGGVGVGVGVSVGENVGVGVGMSRSTGIRSVRGLQSVPVVVPPRA